MGNQTNDLHQRMMLNLLDELERNIDTFPDAKKAEIRLLIKKRNALISEGKQLFDDPSFYPDLLEILPKKAQLSQSNHDIVGERVEHVPDKLNPIRNAPKHSPKRKPHTYN